MRVSVLSAVYNESRHLHEMIDSVRNQDHRDWELIFVDDGSTDETPTIVAEWAAIDPRIKLVSHGRKVGKVAAFNLAFAASSGDAVVLLGGDDRLPPNSLSVRVDALDGGRDDLALFKLATFSDDRRVSGMIVPRGSRVSNSGGVMILGRGLAEQLFPIPAELPSEDIWLGHGAVCIANTVHRQPVVVLEYRVHRGNSNPRRLEFNIMSQRMSERHAAWHLLAESCLPFTDSQIGELRALIRLEQLRASAAVLGILAARDVPLGVRCSMASHSTKLLYSIRSLFYRVFTGWIGR